MLLGEWLPGWNPHPGLRNPASLSLSIWGFLLIHPSFFGVKGGDLSFAKAWARVNFILKLPTDVRELGYRSQFASWVLFGYSVSQTGLFTVALGTRPRRLRPSSPTCHGFQGAGGFSPPPVSTASGSGGYLFSRVATTVATRAFQLASVGYPDNSA